MRRAEGRAGSRLFAPQRKKCGDKKIGGLAPPILAGIPLLSIDAALPPQGANAALIDENATVPLWGYEHFLQSVFWPSRPKCRLLPTYRPEP